MHDIEQGGNGNDRLEGSKGSDLLIGGEGADLLKGGPGEDILIGGFTSHDFNDAAPVAILAEWTSPRDFDMRLQTCEMVRAAWTA